LFVESNLDNFTRLEIKFVVKEVHRSPFHCARPKRSTILPKVLMQTEILSVG